LGCGCFNPSGYRIAAACFSIFSVNETPSNFCRCNSSALFKLGLSENPAFYPYYYPY